MFTLANSRDQAKKLILDSPDYTRKAAVTLLVTLLVIFLHLILSFLGTDTEWSCEIDSSNPKHELICNKLMKLASCRSLTGPLKAEIILDIQTQGKASADIVCPWENAMSELRICFGIGGLLVIIVGIASIIKESRYLAEMHINSAYFFSLLIAIAAVFDSYAINDSRINNFSICNWTEDINLGSGVTREHLRCSYTLYEFTSYLGFLSTIMMLASTYMMSIWKKHLVID